MLAARWKLFGFALLSSSLALSAASADEPAAKAPGLAGIFKQLDANSDGVISKDEVPADKRALAERLFRNADKDGDGKLSTLEFESGLAKQAEPAREAPAGAGPFQGRPGSAGQGPEQLWKMLDRKGTGSVKAEDLPAERRERFTKMLEIADKNNDGALSKEESEKFAARMLPPGPGRERPEGTRPEGDPREGDRKLESRPDGERKPAGRPDGERPQAGPLDGDRPTPRQPDGVRPETRRVGERPLSEGERSFPRPDGRSDGSSAMQRPAVGLFFLIDTDRDGRLSKSELDNAGKVLGKLDRNGDGEVTPQELMQELRPDMRSETRRPEGDRPQDLGDRPREGGRPAIRDGERREGDRPAGRAGDRLLEGERRPTGPRDGEKPREGDQQRNDDKPKTE